MINDLISLCTALVQPVLQLCTTQPLYILIIFIVLFLLIPMLKIVFGK